MKMCSALFQYLFTYIMLTMQIFSRSLQKAIAYCHLYKIQETCKFSISLIKQEVVDNT